MPAGVKVLDFAMVLLIERGERGFLGQSAIGV